MKSNDKTKQTMAKCVPDAEVTLTFWEKRMFRQDMVLQGKCKIIKAFV